MARDPWIVCAANRDKESGLIVCAPRHYDPTMRAIIKATGIPPLNFSEEQGFVDQWGNFFTRKQALDLVNLNGQMRRRCGGDEYQLYSENLY